MDQAKFDRSLKEARANLCKEILNDFFLFPFVKQKSMKLWMPFKTFDFRMEKLFHQLVGTDGKVYKS